jgi:hypothetical protein
MKTYIGHIIVWRLTKERMSGFWLLVRAGGSSKDYLPTATQEYAILYLE